MSSQNIIDIKTKLNNIESSVRNANTRIDSANTRIDNIDVSGSDIISSNLPRASLGIPTYLGQIVKIPSSYNGMHISLSYYRDGSGTISIDGYQIWLNFYDEDDNLLTKEGGSSAFDPASYTEITTFPSTLASGASGTFRIRLNDYQYEMPEEAVSWTVYIRLELAGLGTRNFGYGIMIDNFYCTPFIAT